MSAKIIPFVPRLPHVVLLNGDQSAPQATLDVGTIAAFTVDVHYLHNDKPHWRDTDDKRAEKARVASESRKYEHVSEMGYPNPVARWTSNDVTRVVDLVRAAMPTAAPAGRGFDTLRPKDSIDPFAKDGRALSHLSVLATGLSSKRAPGHTIWFSTAAGYAARIELSGFIPMAALLPFAFPPSGFDLSLTLNRRVAAGQKRGA